MTRVQSLSAVAAVALLFAARPASAGIVVGDLGKFNLITVGDLTTDSDVQGRVLVGGTLHSDSFTLGGQAGTIRNGAPTSDGATIDGVFSSIGPNVSSLNTNNLPAGSVVYGSKVGGGSVGNATQDPDAVAAFTDGLLQSLLAISSAYAEMETTGTVHQSDRNQIAFLDASNAGPVSVFSVDHGFFSSGGTITRLDVGLASTVIINVLGSGPLNASSGLQLFQNFNNSANILFNFADTTAIDGINNPGASLLAPRAVLNTSATLRGGIYVGSVSNVGEIDLPQDGGAFVGGFTGDGPPGPSVAAVPEPSTALMAGLGMTILAVVGRYRRRGRPA